MMYIFFTRQDHRGGPPVPPEAAWDAPQRGPCPSVQAPELEPGRMHFPAGSRTNRATLGLLDIHQTSLTTRYRIFFDSAFNLFDLIIMIIYFFINLLKIR